MVCSAEYPFLLCCDLMLQILLQLSLVDLNLLLEALEEPLLELFISKVKLILQVG